MIDILNAPIKAKREEWVCTLWFILAKVGRNDSFRGMYVMEIMSGGDVVQSLTVRAIVVESNQC